MNKCAAVLYGEDFNFLQIDSDLRLFFSAVYLYGVTRLCNRKCMQKQPHSRVNIKALVRSKNLTALSLALSQKICTRAHAQFLQDLAITLALKTFWAPLNFALILDPLKILKWVQNWATLKTSWARAQGVAKIERERECKFSGWARAQLKFWAH